MKSLQAILAEYREVKDSTQVKPSKTLKAINATREEKIAAVTKLVERGRNYRHIVFVPGSGYVFMNTRQVLALANSK